MHFISPAFAQTAGGQAASGAEVLIQMAPFAIIMVIMYFLIIRPQQRRAKETRDMIAAIRRGDTVVTAGGILGKVAKVTDGPEIEVEIAPNVRVRVMRHMVAEVRAKGEPVKEPSA